MITQVLAIFFSASVLLLMLSKILAMIGFILTAFVIWFLMGLVALLSEASVTLVLLQACAIATR